MGARIAVIGAGPAGFYTTDLLLDAGFAVDVLELLPTPFGLVRSGVAPDHPKIKSVTRVFEKTARHPCFRFFGGVELGVDVTRAELLERYHGVVYAIGTPADRRLGIAGEDRPGVHPATEFVAWYNGHPSCADLAFELDCTRAAVIGNGNVAIDVARMLVLGADELALTDIADHAAAALAAARVREVVVLGRRGPAQAAFTSAELRELGELSGADVLVDPTEVELDVVSAGWLASDTAGATPRRNMDILDGYARRGLRGHGRRIDLRFLRSPVEVVGEGATGRVTGLRVVRNRIEARSDGRMAAVPTGEHETIDCGLVFRAIGYRGRPLPGVPFDETTELISNVDGRVVGEERQPLVGEYAVGWIKRGASGVIGTNKKDAAGTVAKVVEDAAAGRLREPPGADEEVELWLRARVPALVAWTGWQAIDAHEIARGEQQGRPRVKVVRVPELLDVAAR